MKQAADEKKAAKAAQEATKNKDSGKKDDAPQPKKQTPKNKAEKNESK